jgi:hypothetical protein
VSGIELVPVAARRKADHRGMGQERIESRPHSALDHRSPIEFAWCCSRDLARRPRNCVLLNDSISEQNSTDTLFGYRYACNDFDVWTASAEVLSEELRPSQKEQRCRFLRRCSSNVVRRFHLPIPRLQGPWTRAGFAPDRCFSMRKTIRRP